eukprot:5166420-Amphidinium_carterae.1
MRLSPWHRVVCSAEGMYGVQVQHLNIRCFFSTGTITRQGLVGDCMCGSKSSKKFSSRVDDLQLPFGGGVTMSVRITSNCFTHGDLRIAMSFRREAHSRAGQGVRQWRAHAALLSCKPASSAQTPTNEEIGPKTD